MNDPIPSTAKLPVEYIPTTQDVESYRREKEKQIAGRERRLATLLAEHRSKEARDNEGHPDSLRATIPYSEEILAEQKVIPEERASMERNVETLERLYPIPQMFLLTVPTSVEREQINSRMTQLGLNQVTQEQIRATLIEELWGEDWGKGGVGTDVNDAEAEEIASFLDGAWQRQEAHNEAVGRWQEQEAERVLDEGAGAPVTARAEMPKPIISIREQARLTLLIERMMSTNERLRALAARNMDFTRRNALLLARIHIVGATNVGGIPIERDPLTKALSEETAMALREKVDDRSWNELIARIDGMYRLDGGEEKNFDSPLAKPSDQTGSIGANGDIGTSGGNSTTSSTAPAPDAGSETITEKSSGFTSDPELEPQPMGETASPTAEA